MKTLFCKHSGYTLVELMIVVAIIAILASFALPMYGRHIEKTRLAVAKTGLNVARQGIQTVYLRTGQSLDSFNGNLDGIPNNPNVTDDYGRHFRYAVQNGILTATPLNPPNSYGGRAQMDLEGRVTFSDCTYASVCAAMNDMNR